MFLTVLVVLATAVALQVSPGEGKRVLRVPPRPPAEKQELARRSCKLGQREKN